MLTNREKALAQLYADSLRDDTFVSYRHGAYLIVSRPICMMPRISVAVRNPTRIHTMETLDAAQTSREIVNFNCDHVRWPGDGSESFVYRV
jgi:hypothetical protein